MYKNKAHAIKAPKNSIASKISYFLEDTFEIIQSTLFQIGEYQAAQWIS